jgi:HSP20 family molecular chaperone IbpA
LARTRHDGRHGHLKIDMFDLDDRLIMTTELPGVERGDIDLRLEDRDLVVYEVRHAVDEVTEESILRRIPMPFCVTAGDVQATFNHGALRVEVRSPGRGHRAAETAG